MAGRSAQETRRLDSGTPFGGSIGGSLQKAADMVAVFGGVILLLVAIFTVTSVVGRTAFDVPILGDQELVEFGIAVAIFSFMPYCQMRMAHVIVDFFTARFSQGTRNLLDAIMNALFSLCVLVITWRLAVGGVAAFNNGDNTMFLRIPLWWGYVAAFVCCVLWTATCFYSAVKSWRGVDGG